MNESKRNVPMAERVEPSVRGEARAYQSVANVALGLAVAAEIASVFGNGGASDRCQRIAVASMLVSAASSIAAAKKRSHLRFMERVGHSVDGTAATDLVR